MRIVVAGATGNVGSALVESLSGDPEVDSVLGIARRTPQVQIPKVEWRDADVRTAELEPLFDGADAVVCLAWLIQPSRDEATLRSVNVDGSRRVFEAAAAASVRNVVYASSVGAYAEGPKDRPVDESHPTTGIQSSFYSRHKAEVERILDEFESLHSDVRVVRLRPGLIFGRLAASGIRRLFLGPLFPGAILRRGLIPVVPDNERLVFQAVHRSDVAEAYRLAIRSDVRGAFNVAAEPVIDPDVLSSLLGARKVSVPAAVLRAGAGATWRLRLQPTPSGWVDLGLGVPVMDTGRARSELGWAPKHTAVDALSELLAGLREGAGYPTPPLEPGGKGPFRLHEFRTGIGAKV